MFPRVHILGAIEAPPQKADAAVKGDGAGGLRWSSVDADD